MSALIFVQNSNGTCGVCWESLDALDDNRKIRPVVAHEGLGERHPVHADCFQKYCLSALPPNVFEIKCMSCRKFVNIKPLFPQKEKKVSLTEIFVKNAVISGLGAAVAGAGMAGVVVAITEGVVAARAIPVITAATVRLTMGVGMITDIAIEKFAGDRSSIQKGMTVGAVSALATIFVRPSLPIALATMGSIGAVVGGSLAVMKVHTALA
jgi:hypothetical protein